MCEQMGEVVQEDETGHLLFFVFLFPLLLFMAQQRTKNTSKVRFGPSRVAPIDDDDDLGE